MDAQTRHRLVGVFLLLLLAALVTPVIFRSPEQVRVALDMTLPEPPEIEPLSFSPVVSDDELEDAVEQIEDSRVEMAEAGEQAQRAITEAAENEQPEVKDEAVSKPENVAVSDIMPAGWTLQIAAFSNESAALALSKRLRDADYSAYVRKSEASGDALYRVFVGPELERKRSEHLREQLIRDIRFKMEGLVIPYSL